MTGKFTDYSGGKFVFLTSILASICFGVCIKILLGYFTVPCLVFCLAANRLLAAGRFFADEDKIVFRVGLIKREYSYAEIVSTVSQTGFSSGRLGMLPYIKLLIKLTDGSIVSVRDDNISKNAFSTPENHKQFQENHQFTKLSDYIN